MGRVALDIDKIEVVKHCHLSVRKMSLRFHCLVPSLIQQRRLEETQKTEVDVLIFFAHALDSLSLEFYVLRCYDFIRALFHIAVKLSS